MRLRLSRKRNDEEGAKEKLYTYVEAVNVNDLKACKLLLLSPSSYISSNSEIKDTIRIV